MSEKDIIDKFIEIVENAREESWYEYYDTLRNTLDLIKKLQQELQAEKEKNKNLEKCLQAKVVRDFDYFISKDKIKEKIKELEKSKELDEDRKKLPFDLLQEQNKNIDYEIQALKELLN